LSSALVGDEWSVSRPARFTPEEDLLVPIVQEVGWTPEPVWTTRRSENSLHYWDSNSDLSVIQPVASPNTDRANPCSQKKKKKKKKKSAMMVGEIMDV
jgi:hypothetical protein